MDIIVLLVPHRSGEVRAGLELLQRDNHGVGPEEENEGHHSQVGHKLAGITHQSASILHTLLLTELSPVQS